MKKLFLFVAAIVLSVAAHAFELSMEKQGIRVNVTADNTDISDLFGDGKVSVAFEANNQAVVVTMTNDTLSATSSNPLIYFEGGGTYQNIILNIAGNCKLDAVGNAIWIKNATMYVNSSSPNAKLDISSEVVPVHMQEFADLYLGRIAEHDFIINIKTTSTTYPLFYGNGSSTQRLFIYYAHANIATTGNNLITQDIDRLTVLGSLSDNVYVKDDKDFYKNDAPYKGSFSITAPYPIRLAYSDHITPANADDVPHAALKNGKISYDKATKTLTLDNVQFEKHLSFYIPNVTVYLKGNNVLSNVDKSSVNQLDFIGTGATINGDKNATLTIQCEESSNGISVRGALTIGDFEVLSIKKAKKGLLCDQRIKTSTNILTIQSTPVQVSAAKENAVIGFNNLVITNPNLYLADGLKYDTNQRQLLTAGNDPAKEMVMEYDPGLFISNPQAADEPRTNKVFINGHLYIRDGDHLYDAQGKMIHNGILSE